MVEIHLICILLWLPTRVWSSYHNEEVLFLRIFSIFILVNKYKTYEVFITFIFLLLTSFSVFNCHLTKYSCILISYPFVIIESTSKMFTNPSPMSVEYNLIVYIFQVVTMAYKFFQHDLHFSIFPDYFT